MSFTHARALKHYPSFNTATIAFGFTLVELLVVLTIVSILAIIVVPQFQTFKNSLLLQQIQHQLRLDLAYARGIAKRTHQQVVVTALRIEAEKNWQEGWKVIVDTNSNQQLDTSDYQIRTYMLPEGFSLVWNRQTPVVFRHNGFTHTPGTFNLCGTSESAYQIILNMAGATRIKRGAVTC